MSSRSIRYCPYPKECDELLDVLAKNYEFVADEYPTAWKFRQFLKGLTICDFSEILDDVYYEKDQRGGPIIMCKRVIFFTCRERDMERMCRVLDRLGGAFVIFDAETGYTLYGGLADVW